MEALVQSRHIILLSLHVSPANGETLPGGAGSKSERQSVAEDKGSGTMRDGTQGEVKTFLLV